VSSVSIIDLEASQAKSYLRESRHYVNFELPDYFNFDGMLTIANALMAGKQLSDVCAKKQDGKPAWPKDYEGVNHTILSNKNGSFAWRPMQIIHPILYVDLVNLITEESNWKTVQAAFNSFGGSCVRCISLPRKSQDLDSDKAASVKNWWDKIEQESIRMALDYKYVFVTDVSDCYGSIYTHSLEWAFSENGRLGVKQSRASGNDTPNLGTEIDTKLRNMNQGQTVGIPQGSTLMDLIAEAVMGGTDKELTAEINKKYPEIENHAFQILRYRDDYRIFTNDFQLGHEIMKLLNTVLYNWGMKMNTSKTFESDDVITSSVKVEKLEQVSTAPIRQYYQKEALRIYALSKKYPNAGLIATELSRYYDRISRAKHLKHFDHEVITSIVTLIAYFSPRYIPQAAAVVSKILEDLDTESVKNDLIKRIHKRFSGIPNTGLIDVWLQRIAAPAKVSLGLSSPITDVAISKKDNTVIWNSDWLDSIVAETINKTNISSLSIELDEGTITPVIEPEEFQLFRKDYF
jgi:RNA-directed DNA polymerase